MIEIALLLPLSLPVLWRAAQVLAQVERSGFRSSLQFQAFAVAYALLGAVTLQLVVDSLRGSAPEWSDVGFVAASALLILCDRRRTRVGEHR